MRQLVLDTETTGLEVTQGHRIIEIGCVEVINRRLTGNNYHVYINPDREVDPGAYEVHGISDDFLVDKPLFQELAEEFLNYIRGAELIIHNAPFDVGFIDMELALLPDKPGKTEDFCSVTDTLVMARKRHPGQRNNLDALCKRYGVNNSQRDLHGALLDAEILADLYLVMTGGQTSLLLNDEDGSTGTNASGIRRLPTDRRPLPVIRATTEELSAHQARLKAIEESAGICIWNKTTQIN